MMKKIRILVVDDSLLFRRILADGLNSDPTLEVVAEAADAFAARDAIIKYSPDVMTLDVELPRMNGIEFLRKLMPQRPIPVVVISALSNAVFDALRAGAVDYVVKPSVNSREQLQAFIRQELAVKVKIASTARVGGLKQMGVGSPLFKLGKFPPDTLIAIGASTGGTEAIFDVVRQLDVDIPGIVIVQHMPPGFTEMYARRLNNECRIEVREAKTGDRVMPGKALLAPGNMQMSLVKVNGGYQVECKNGPKVGGHRPAVNVLFDSVAQYVGKNAIGVILTGMGADGAQGLLKIRNTGAETIGQNEETCVVYGMPKVAYDIGAVKYQLPLSEIPKKIYTLLSQKQAGRKGERE